MRGEVEIWRGDTLVSREPSMLVDGAGELLADVMTVSPSLSGVEDHATSSILDSSNYTIQAISFGTGSEAFTKNAHEITDHKLNNIINTATIAILVGTIPNISINFLSSTVPHTLEGSSYNPVVGLPRAPSPMMTVFEENTSVSAVIPSADASANVTISSVFPGNGQLTNFLPSAIMSSVMENTALSSPLSATVAAILLGAFPEGSSAPYGNRTKHFYYEDGNTVFSPTDAPGLFNEASSMDVSGFVNMVMSSVPNATYNMSSTSSGLCISSNATFSGDGIVEYSVTLGAGDIGFSNSYGGIYHLGLWTIDMKQSLLAGNTPPFSFSVLNNPRKYKLFAIKSLSKNLCFINDNGTDAGDLNYTDLTIKWRLHFL